MTRYARACLALLLGVTLTAALMAQQANPAPVKITTGKTDAAGFIPYWIALEPLNIPEAESQGKGVDVDYLKAAGGEGEAAAAPVPGDTLTYNGEKHRWKTVVSDVGSPVVDIENVAGVTLHAVTYLVAYVQLDHAEPKATIAWSTDDGGSLWVNGKEVDRHPGPRSCPIDDSVAKNIPLKQGVNIIMLKVLNIWGGSNAVARLVGSDDKPLAGVPILMAPEGKTAPKDAFWYQVDTAQKPLEGTFTEYLASKPKK